MKTVGQQRISRIRENSRYKLHISQELGIDICLYIFLRTCIHTADTYLLLLFACVNEHKQLEKKIHTKLYYLEIFTFHLQRKIERRKKI